MESGYNNERPILGPSNHSEMMDYASHCIELAQTEEVIEELTDHLLLWITLVREDAETIYYRMSIKTRHGAVMAEMVACANECRYVGIIDIDRGETWHDDARESLADQAVGDFMARWDLRAHMQNTPT